MRSPFFCEGVGVAITELEMADLVRETCHAGGDGPLVLGGPLPGYRGFAAALGPGATFPYVIQGVADLGQWEAGTGGLDGEGRLLRTPQASSAGGGAVDFVAGEKHVGLALHAGWVAQVNAHGHGLDEVAGLEAALAGKQAANGELSAIAALATSGFGRGALTLANGAAFRSYIGAGTSSTVGTVTAVSAGSGMAFATIAAAGSVTLGTPSSVTLGSTNGVAAGTHSHAFAPGGTSAQYLRGDGSLATFPTGSALTRTNDSNVTLTLGGGAASALLNAASITVGWSGQLPVARGGSGAASLTGYVKGNGAAAMSASATIPSTDISGLGSMATQAASAVAITGGDIATPYFSALAASPILQAISTVAIDLGTPASSAALGSLFLNASGLGTAALGDYAAGIAFGRKGTGRRGALIAGKHTGTDVNQMGLAFLMKSDTNAAGSALVERVVIDHVGIIYPSIDNSSSFGLSTNRWSTIYAATGTINTSDARAKCDLGSVDTALIDAWGAVAWRRYRFADAVADKGDAARWHLGLVAQQVREAIDGRLGEGAAVRLGLLCHDRWDAEPELRGEDGAIVRPARAAGDRWGLRYDECFVLEALWQRRAIAALAARLDALETGGDHVGG